MSDYYQIWKNLNFKICMILPVIRIWPPDIQKESSLVVRSLLNNSGVHVYISVFNISTSTVSNPVQMKVHHAALSGLHNPSCLEKLFIVSQQQSAFRISGIYLIYSTKSTFTWNFLTSNLKIYWCLNWLQVEKSTFIMFIGEHYTVDA